MPTNPQFLIAARTMIDQLLARGQRPLVFLMNPTTAGVIAADMAEFHFNQKSAFARFWHLVRHGKTVPKLETLHGVPVQEMASLPDGAMHLQCVANISPQAIGEAMKAQAAQNQQRGQEFWEKQRVEPPAAAEGDVAPTLNDLASGSGDRPSCSDVLMKAMERADELSGVVVIRVYPNNRLDMSLNVDHYAATGILQKAMIYLAHGDQV
jgi:hypothetical protein